MLSIVLAVLAATSNAVSSVLQRKANRDVQERPFDAALLLFLLTRKVWLLGLLAMIASFLLQATALGLGTLSVVEPVLVLELPLTLLIASITFRHRLRAIDLLAALVVTAGLALLIGVLDPSGGDARHVSSALVVLATGATVAGVCVVVAVGNVGPRRWRAALLGVGAGSGFGLTAGLMKLAVARLSVGGAEGLFTAWETYAMALAGIASVGLVQAALNAGTLVAAQPGITLFDPLVSVLWGTVVTGEHTRTGPILILAVGGGALIVTGVLGLARSPSLTDSAAS